MHLGPKIVRDGLVFGYDTGANPSSGFDHNSNQRRFFKGAPVANTSNLTSIATYWNNSGTAAWSSNDNTITRLFSDLPVFSMEKITNGNSHIGIGNTAASASVEYTYSVYIFIPSSNSAGMSGSPPYMRPQPANYNAVTLNYNGSTSWGSWPRDQWIRIKGTATPTSYNGNGVTSAYISCYLNTAGDKVYFTAPQFTTKGFSTPFINGTRSVSGSLIDLTKSTTIDVSNVSFGSDGLPTFDGTDDYIVISNPGVSNTQGFTIELVTNPDSYSSSPMVITPQSAGIDHFIRFPSTGKPYMRVVIDADSTVQDFAVTSTLPTGNYTHLVFTYNATSGGKAYFNGNLEGSGSPNFTAQEWSSSWYIGQRGNNTFYYDGSLPVTKIYNRALSAQEVQQNYKAYKNRFNI